MKTREMILQFDWLSAFGSSSQEEVMYEFLRGSETIKSLSKQQFSKRNKHLLNNLSQGQVPYFREVVRKVFNRKVKKPFNFNKKAFMRHIQLVASRPLTAFSC